MKKISKILFRAKRGEKVYHMLYSCIVYYPAQPNVCVDKIGSRPRGILCGGKIGSGRGGGIFEMCVWHDINLQCSAPTSTRPAEQEVASTTQPAKNLRPLATSKRVLTAQDKNLLGKNVFEISILTILSF